MATKSILKKSSRRLLARKGLHLLLLGQGMPLALKIIERNDASRFNKCYLYRNFFDDP